MLLSARASRASLATAPEHARELRRRLVVLLSLPYCVPLPGDIVELVC